MNTFFFSNLSGVIVNKSAERIGAIVGLNNFGESELEYRHACESLLPMNDKQGCKALWVRVSR
jgi:ribosomal 30S subunit maturation factor RimM